MENGRLEYFHLFCELFVNKVEHTSWRKLQYVPPFLLWVSSTYTGLSIKHKGSLEVFPLTFQVSRVSHQDAWKRICRSSYTLVHSSHSWSWCGQWYCPQDDSQRTCLGQDKCIRKQKRNAAQWAVKINESKLAHFCLTALYCPLSPICWFMVVHFIYFLILFCQLGASPG